MSLKDIVNVTITRETTSVSRVGFSVINILGAHKRFNERIKYYSSLSSVAEDFVSTDKEYVAASNIFSQNPSPSSIAISRRRTNDNVVITISDVQNTTVYSTVINGTAFTYTSDADATNLEIAAGLVAAINLGTEPVTASDNVNGTYDLDPDVAETPFTLSVGSRQSIAAYTTPDGVEDDLDAVLGISADWYGLVVTIRTQADVEDVAAWTEANKKLFGTASADADIINTTVAADTTTVAATLKAAAYARSFVFYHALAATVFPEAALLGTILWRDPGSYTAMFKTLSGITKSALTDTQSKNARDKNCMVYEEIGGVNITREGKVAEGEFIDIIILVDWTEARVQEGVYSRFVNLPKVPFIDAGISIVEGEIRAVYDQGLANGGFTSDPAPVYVIPKASSISTANKLARNLPDVKFTFYLAGAIHATEINGVVSV